MSEELNKKEAKSTTAAPKPTSKTKPTSKPVAPTPKPVAPTTLPPKPTPKPVHTTEPPKPATKKVAPTTLPPKPVVEKYEYKPGVGEELLMDIPSDSLNKKPIMKSNKEIYESYVKELVNFSLSVNNEIVYDSSLDKKNEFPVIFENDFFILFGKKYSYNGLKIQKINKR